MGRNELIWKDLAIELLGFLDRLSIIGAVICFRGQILMYNIKKSPVKHINLNLFTLRPVVFEFYS